MNRLHALLHRWSYRLWVAVTDECPVHPAVRLARNVACFPCAVRKRQSTLRRGAST
jgi:hypothetical protein